MRSHESIKMLRLHSSLTFDSVVLDDIVRSSGSNFIINCVFSRGETHVTQCLLKHFSPLSALGLFTPFVLCLQNVVLELQAHASRLAAVAFSPDGLKVATASEKGTVIRYT